MGGKARHIMLDIVRDSIIDLGHKNFTVNDVCKKHPMKKHHMIGYLNTLVHYRELEYSDIYGLYKIIKIDKDGSSD